MKKLVRPWRRTVARLLVIALAVAAAPVNCLAGEPPGNPPAAPTLAASVQQAVQNEVGKVEKVAPRAANRASASAAAEPSGNFFKSRAGIVTIVLLGAGTAYALYSTSHDRVKSPKVPYGGTWQ